MSQDRDYYFIIYGGGSDVIQNVYKKYQNSYFLSIIKKTQPTYKLGETISTNETDWFKRFDDLLGKSEKRS